MLENFKRQVPIKLFMVGYLCFLLAYSSLALAKPERIFWGGLIVLIYAALDLIWTRLRDRIWYLPVSSWISGLILGLVALPLKNIFIILGLPLLAVFGKQVLWFGKPRHIFNPAGFALGVASFFSPVVSWWALSWGMPVFWLTLLAGIFILWKQEKWQEAVPFFIIFAFGSGFSSLLYGSVVFFATVMLIEPITSNFPARRDKIIYGSLAGVFAVIFADFTSFEPFIFGLLASDFISGILFL